MTTAQTHALAERLDAINEFDREPVSEDRLQGPGNFIGLYAGEHVAGTEFVIGPLFVAHGVAAGDLILGLFAGNLLAVLSWAFICAPIATRTRLNLYWKLRKIAGPNLLFVYNIVTSWMRGPIADSNPWRAQTLEWQVSSPPPIFNFDEIPQVVAGPYEYGVPGARHAVMSPTTEGVHEPEEVHA